MDRVRAQSVVSVLFQNDLAQNAPQLFKPADAPRIVLIPASQAIVGVRERLAEPLLVLLFAVGTILLIACANIAGLVLARSARRAKEMSVRLALGASHSRIVRQVLTENVLLSLSGGLLGILLAYWGTSSLVAFMSTGGLWPSVLQVHPDAKILGFAAAASLLTGILFGLAPASRIFRVELTSALKESSGASGSIEHRAGRRWSLGSALVVAQIALSALALVGAGLLVRTLENLKGIDVGFDTRNILTFGIDPTLNGYSGPQIQSFYNQLRDRINAIPGVLSSTYSYDALLSGNRWRSSFHLADGTKGVTEGLAVGPDFVATMGIPLLSGRALKLPDFDPTLNPLPVLVNQSFAKRFFGDQNPLGQHLTDLCRESVCEVVGLVGDAKYESLRKPLGPVVYVPQRPSSTIFEIHTAGNPVSIVPAIREAVGKLDANLPVYGIRTQADQLDQILFQNRLIARLSSFFGLLALLLASIGVYGLLSYEVVCRTREIGIRVALGAQRRDVLRLVVGRGILLTTVGLLLGVALAAALTRFLASLLYGVSGTDPLTFAGVAALLIFVALAACYVPARRAMRVEPIKALRYG
ncbi:MAG: FtsX-like permease family protein [Candidatus Acidiferrales bacterium]